MITITHQLRSVIKPDDNMSYKMTHNGQAYYPGYKVRGLVIAIRLKNSAFRSR